MKQYICGHCWGTGIFSTRHFRAIECTRCGGTGTATTPPRWSDMTVPAGDRKVAEDEELDDSPDPIDIDPSWDMSWL